MACVVQTFVEEGISYRFEGSTVKIHGNLMGKGIYGGSISLWVGSYS